MFNVYLDILLDRLNSSDYMKQFTYEWTAYADDLVVYCKDIEHVKELLAFLVGQEYSLGLQFNWEKSAILPMRYEPEQDLSKEDFRREYWGLSQVHRYRYLGIEFTNDGSLDTHFNELNKRCYVEASKIWALADNLSPVQKFRLIQILVATHIDYVGPLALHAGQGYRLTAIFRKICR